MNNSIISDLNKIKEDAIRIQENDLKDTISSIENEATKSSFVIGFAGVLFAIVFATLDQISLPYAVVFTLLLLLSISLAFWNITSKKIFIHTNVDDIFVNSSHNEWGKYLDSKHLHLRKSYNNAKDLLYRKTAKTKWSFCFLILASLLLVFIKIFKLGGQ